MKLLNRALRRIQGRVEDAAEPASVTTVEPAPPTIEGALETARQAWFAQMSTHANHLGVVDLPGYPILDAKHLANCRMFPLREDILDRMPKGGKAVELGVQEGEFSQEILKICRPAELHLIDIDLTKFRVAERFAYEIERGVVTLHEGDSATTISSFPDNYFDFIYVDADHGYAGVKRDIAAAVPKLGRDGYLLFNDYTFWSPAECMPYGVMQAVNELCIEDEWEIVYFAFGYMGYSDVAVRPIRRRNDLPSS